VVALTIRRMRAARANGWLNAHRGFLWLVVAYLAVVVAVAALSHLFGTPPPPTTPRFPGSD
jgi:hypothetical protein